MNNIKKFLQYLALFLLACFLVGLTWLFLMKPSLSRDWSIDQKILASIDFNDNLVEVKNVRNFKYDSVDEYAAEYYDRTYDLNKIESVYYIIEPFSKHDGPAHTMLSFGFSDGANVVISAEIRKEKAESFDPVKGVMNQYELIYVIGDENDLIKLRANYRKDVVRLYPIKTPKENIRKLFVSAMQRADKLTKQPEFYNTVWNNCTTNILNNVNSLRTEKISWSKKVLLPANSDEIAFEADLIDTKLPFNEAREYYRINDLSEKFANDPNYSALIRKERR